MGGGGGGGGGDSSPVGQEVVGSNPAPGTRSLLVGSVSVQCDQLRQKSWSSCTVSVWQDVKLSDVSLRIGPQDSLVADDER